MSVARRRFLHALAMAPVLPALGDSPAAAPVPAASPSPSPAAAPRDELARALTQVIETRYGAQLAAGDLAVIHKGIADALENAEKLRAVRLGNGDEPVTHFQARPPRSTPHSGGTR